MLGANELRIGNLVLDDTSKNIMIVSRIESVDHTEWNSGDQYNIRCLQFGTIETYYDGNFKPIPLTEEWLLKLGFYKYKGDNSDCFLNGFETACNMRMLFYKGSLIKNINFVHQIQNLYFALTGEELTIKKL